MVVIDDDELSRAVVSLIGGEAGFFVETFKSGEQAIAYLQEEAGSDPQARSAMPFAILTDLQMPGLAGASLALRLRACCGPEMVLLAISGSRPVQADVADFDGFLLKPFSAGELTRACERFTRSAPEAEGSETLHAAVLSEATYAKLTRSLPLLQLDGLYRMCIDDAAKRIASMRRALEEGNDAAYRSAAHAIKGGCGMVGALELAALAATMEQNGLSEAGKDGPYPATPTGLLDRFLAASNRLERMLGVKANERQARETTSAP